MAGWRRRAASQVRPGGLRSPHGSNSPWLAPLPFLLTTTEGASKHRVRVGPFKYKRAAVICWQEFEAKERRVTFIADPLKTAVKVADSPGDDA
ncbi:hypothetical protein WME73_20685 [Sorangium sp. So ce302]|uniref:hypothetical protein n=1 Tax=unclassified Sorangium TaxID=2621164 RepID=UPI003F624D1C